MHRARVVRASLYVGLSRPTGRPGRAPGRAVLLWLWPSGRIKIKVLRRFECLKPLYSVREIIQVEEASKWPDKFETEGAFTATCTSRSRRWTTRILAEL